MKNLLLSIGIAAAVVCAPPAAWVQDKASQAFVKKAIEGNLAEVEMGKLAQQNSASDGVRQIGKDLEQDHSAANDKATAAAKDLGLTDHRIPREQAQHHRLALASSADHSSGAPSWRAVSRIQSR